MTKSEDDLIVLPSTNASKIFANTQKDPIFNPNVEVKLEEEDLDFWLISTPKTAQDHVEEENDHMNQDRVNI